MSLKLRFRPDAEIETNDQQGYNIRTTESGTLPFKKLSTGLTQVFQKLSNGGASEAQLSKIVGDADGFAGSIRFYQYLGFLDTHALLTRTLVDENQTLATVIPMARHFRFNDKLVDMEQTYTVSRFAYMRNVDGKMILETPKGFAQVILHEPMAHALYGSLSQPHTVASLHETFPQLSEETVKQFVNVLLNANVLDTADTTPSNAEQMWEFHDLLFHSRSRVGRHNYPYGGTFPFYGKFDPLPLVREIESETIIQLPKPDLDVLKEEDVPFTAVLESRRSLRYQDNDNIMTLEQLGEFLYRTARISHVIPSAEGQPQYCLRPVPGGGAIHELEIYPTIDRVEGLPSGIYYYHPLNHELYLVAERNEYVARMMHMAWVTAAEKSRPQVLFNITSRIGRMQWKYRSMVYAASLKHVGALYQTMYLVATAMGLAPCALGGGNSDLFGLAAGLDYLEETLVGEFVLGSKGTPPEGETQHV